MKREAAVLIPFAVASVVSDQAANIAVKYPSKIAPAAAVFGWTGLYIGGHVGYGGGTFGPGTNPLPETNSVSTSAAAADDTRAEHRTISLHLVSASVLTAGR